MSNKDLIKENNRQLKDLYDYDKTIQSSYLMRAVHYAISDRIRLLEQQNEWLGRPERLAE
ncbi:MAG: hypothetical protein ABF820_09645 [Sporolactobacillus sp.]